MSRSGLVDSSTDAPTKANNNDASNQAAVKSDTKNMDLFEKTAPSKDQVNEDDYEIDDLNDEDLVKNLD